MNALLKLLAAITNLTRAGGLRNIEQVYKIAKKELGDKFNVAKKQIDDAFKQGKEQKKLDDRTKDIKKIDDSVVSEGIETLADGSGRTEVWPVVWEEISNAPFFGNGILYDDYFMKDYVTTNIGEYASRHWGGVWNSYLSLLLDVGVIGCIAYVYFWIIVFKKSHYKNMAIAFIAMCLLSGFTESWMAASMNAFTPMMFLFWAIQLQPATNK